MKKTDNLIILILFAAFLLVLGAGGWILKDKDFSENENRVLQQMPAVSADSVLSGAFEEQFQDYQDDQFPFRNGWITMKTAAKLSVFSRDINGVYIGKDGYLIEKAVQEDVDEKQFASNMQAVSQFCRRLPAKITKSVLLVPTTAAVMEDKLPAGAAPFDEEALAKEARAGLKDLHFVDLYDIFKKQKNTQLYYKTDHHWTTEGAALAYRQWRRQTGESRFSLQGLVRKVLSDDFQGTLYSKVLWDDGTRDQVTAYADAAQEGCAVTADGKDIDGIYQKRYLQEKDKYAVFFGGNYGKLEIDTGRRSGRTLLLIKDSFANCFAPFAAADFRKICMVDLRYFSGNLQAYIEENNVTDVVILYSMSNMIKDKNISVLKNKGDILS